MSKRVVEVLIELGIDWVCHCKWLSEWLSDRVPEVLREWLSDWGSDENFGDWVTEWVSKWFTVDTIPKNTYRSLFLIRFFAFSCGRCGNRSYIYLDNYIYTQTTKDYWLLMQCLKLLRSSDAGHKWGAPTTHMSTMFNSSLIVWFYTGWKIFYFLHC